MQPCPWARAKEAVFAEAPRRQQEWREAALTGRSETVPGARGCPTTARTAECRGGCLSSPGAAQYRLPRRSGHLPAALPPPSLEPTAPSGLLGPCWTEGSPYGSCTGHGRELQPGSPCLALRGRPGCLGKQHSPGRAQRHCPPLCPECTGPSSPTNYLCPRYQKAAALAWPPAGLLTPAEQAVPAPTEPPAAPLPGQRRAALAGAAQCGHPPPPRAKPYCV